MSKELLDALNSGCTGEKHTKKTFCDVFASTGRVEVVCSGAGINPKTCDHCRKLINDRTDPIFSELLCVLCLIKSDDHRNKKRGVVSYQNRSEWIKVFKSSYWVCGKCRNRATRESDITLLDIFSMMERMEERLEESFARIEEKIRKQSETSR